MTDHPSGETEVTQGDPSTGGPMSWDATVAAIQTLVGKEVRAIVGDGENPGFSCWAELNGELRAQVITRYEGDEVVTLKVGWHDAVVLPRSVFNESWWHPDYHEDGQRWPSLEVKLGAYGVMLDVGVPGREGR
jgi:hypothetical protein